MLFRRFVRIECAIIERWRFAVIMARGHMCLVLILQRVITLLAVFLRREIINHKHYCTTLLHGSYKFEIVPSMRRKAVSLPRTAKVSARPGLDGACVVA